jgi:hypothetical protein
MKRINAIYLHSDGHLKVTYSEKTVKYGTVEYVEIHEKANGCKRFTTNLNTGGRIVFHNGGFLSLFKACTGVLLWKNNGSAFTEARSISCNTISFEMPSGYVLLDICSLNDQQFTQSQITYQEAGYDEVFKADLQLWGNKHVAKVHMAK